MPFYHDSLIAKWLSLMCRFFLVSQKHTAQLVQNDSWTIESNEGTAG